MQDRNYLFGLSSLAVIIILGATAKFTLHMYMASGYGFFFDEFYTIALSRHLAFGYVDLPPLVPVLVALSRILLGESLFALHIVPALAGSATLVFVCLITKEFGGKRFAVALTAVGFILVPLWLSVNSIFCYDSIDQLVLAGFLYTLVRFLKTGNRKLWLLLGLIAGIACLTKMTLLYMGPAFLLALLLSKYRKDLLTPWPWLGAVLCVVVVSPYLLWEYVNHWPTLEYWNNYGTIRVYQASIAQYATNLQVYMNGWLLPLWAAGLYRIFRPFKGVSYRFLGVLFLGTLALLFGLHASGRMVGAVFMPLLAAGAVFVEELLAGWRWETAGKVVATMYLTAVTIIVIPLALPILPVDVFKAYAATPTFKFLEPPLVEFVGNVATSSPLMSSRLGWDDMVQEVAGVYHELPAEERAIAGIYSNSYATAGAIDELGPQYGLPHAVSGSLNYYLWGPGYSWDVMIILAGRTNPISVFFDQCEPKGTLESQGDGSISNIWVCRTPKVSADDIWGSLKSYR
jgi:4-amino-4-deoxy-L-arabinose transferase-like glycosyltransferase